MLPMRDEDEQTVKIELLSQWKLEAEFRNIRFSSKEDPVGREELTCVGSQLSHVLH